MTEGTHVLEPRKQGEHKHRTGEQGAARLNDERDQGDADDPGDDSRKQK